MRKGDFASGEKVKIGARVDSGVYESFREWVVEQNGGRAYSNVGDALERAMLEYMDDDNISQQLSEVSEQTTRNGALLRRLVDAVESDSSQKVRDQITTTDEVPRGKNPGDRKKRELHVIRALYESDGADKWQADTIKKAIQEVAGVSSPQTVTDYLDSITSTRAFMSTRKPNTWRMDREAVREMLADHAIEVNA